MTTFLRPVLEYLVLLPGLLLAYLPMKQYLRIRPGRLSAFMILLTLLLCLGGGGLCYMHTVPTKWGHLFIAAIAGAIYVRTLRVSLWKSVSVFLAVYAVFVCLSGVVNVLDLILYPGSTAPWLSLATAFLYNLFCWLFVGLAWHPATHAARELLEDDAFAQTWFVFWIVPLLFIALNLFIAPIHPELMYQGRILQIYLVVCLSLLLLLLLFYALFYLMAASLNRNTRLRQENQFLSMQQAQYDNLRSAIAETRQARHDMRHHFDALLSLADRKDWDSLERYLSEVRGSIPNSELNLCENTAVDGIASHYGLLYHKYQIPFSFALDLPINPPVPEMDLCVVLSNLLENALEASLRTAPVRRHIQVKACLHSTNMILLTVENAFDGTIREKDGIFQSSKRKGDGVGIQSIRRIAEKSGGYCRFLYEDGTFCANVMLRA